MASLHPFKFRSATNHTHHRTRAITGVACSKPRTSDIATHGPHVHATAAPLILAAISTLLTAAPAFAAGAPELFTNKCAGCHMNGANVLAVGATLFPDDLRRNGVDSSEALYKIIYSGKGKMPGFGKECAPKGACTFGPRLSDEEVAALATYVQERAAEGWKS
ncbi:hypothetical protein VOLCADRAFT_121636 [Volvox carteri f. nagariensis]|uniref:Cytochrome c-553 n=1 Tax=Volvox carteri f. nagariensis TaxID=3068 RepID=D8UFK0_VOLCA|nr:uncharacterized protein VOLCADRAFT_121636 [Volvox carteri f. nagariensis]EFJ41518.1 hypothetical protein VOLCADRAFT_121636 [Volvox carteri f. nagariensis]|eukprot:XP_002957463.1 hypothetical protein VOLCADRAFT_121636 [Volvox carteri f. nagariensis]